jgi:stress response protein YsnF
MAKETKGSVVDREGTRGRLASDLQGPRCVVALEDGTMVAVDSNELRPRGDGEFEIDGTFSTTIPVVREEVTVDKRVQEGTVRIRTTVQERTETVEAPIVVERAEIERVPVDRYVDEMPQVRQEGDVTVVPVVEEVIEKRLKLREEVRIRRTREESSEPREVRLRSTHVDVERGEDAEHPSSNRV